MDRQSGAPGTAPKRWGSIRGGQIAAPPRPPRATESPPAAENIQSDEVEPDNVEVSDVEVVDIEPDTVEVVDIGPVPIEVVDIAPVDLEVVDAEVLANGEVVDEPVADAASDEVRVVDVEVIDVDLGHVAVIDVEPADFVPDGGEPNDRDWLDIDPTDREPADLASVFAEPSDTGWVEPTGAGPADIEASAVQPDDPAPSAIDLTDLEPVELAPVDIEPVDVAPDDGTPAPFAWTDIEPHDLAPVDIAALAVNGVAVSETSEAPAAMDIEPTTIKGSTGKPLAIKGVAASTVEPPPDDFTPVTFVPGADPRFIGRPIGTLARPWYQASWFRVLVVAVVGVGLAFVAYSALRSSPDGIDARPAAPTPDGFRVVTSEDHQFAVPRVWASQVLDDEGIDSLADRADANAAHAGDALREAARNDDIIGAKTIAFNLENGDNVNLIPYRAVEGDPRDVGTLAEIKKSFSRDTVGASNVSVVAEPTNVHGFPAATVTVHATVDGRPMTRISTIVQTGDPLYQLTVTSQSAERAIVLSRQIVPTFAPR